MTLIMFFGYFFLDFINTRLQDELLLVTVFFICHAFAKDIFVVLILIKHARFSNPPSNVSDFLFCVYTLTMKILPTTDDSKNVSAADDVHDIDTIILKIMPTLPSMSSQCYHRRRYHRSNNLFNSAINDRSDHVLFLFIMMSSPTTALR